MHCFNPRLNAVISSDGRREEGSNDGVHLESRRYGSFARYSYLILVFLTVDCAAPDSRVRNPIRVGNNFGGRNIDLSFGSAKPQLI